MPESRAVVPFKPASLELTPEELARFRGEFAEMSKAYTIPIGATRARVMDWEGPRRADLVPGVPFVARGPPISAQVLAWDLYPGGDVLVPQQNDHFEVPIHHLQRDPNAGFVQLGALGSGPGAPARARARAPRVARPPRAAQAHAGFAPVVPRPRVPRHTQKVQLHAQPTMSMGRSPRTEWSARAIS